MTLALAICCALLVVLYVRLAVAVRRLWRLHDEVDTNLCDTIDDLRALTETCSSITRSVGALKGASTRLRETFDNRLSAVESSQRATANEELMKRVQEAEKRVEHVAQEVASDTSWMRSRVKSLEQIARTTEDIAQRAAKAVNSANAAEMEEAWKRALDRQASWDKGRTP